MINPYASQPDFTYWKRAVSCLAGQDVDPVVDVPFQIDAGQLVATAGSCFAQYISRTLLQEGFSYLVTEPNPATSGAVDEGYGVFPARFGNVYTVRQLLQLFLRAYGLFDPLDKAWLTEDGRLLDPFRPRIQEGGFSTVASLAADRVHHLAAVRQMFEECDVFVFTLGLTEGWVSNRDGAVFPLARGVTGSAGPDEWYRPENFSVDSMVSDLIEFVDKLRTINRSVKIILTVSPVPLIATFEKRHVMVSTIYSKSALRVVAEMVSRARENIVYFPAYEIITGPHSGGRYFAEDLREVTADGVAHVMGIFKRHFLSPGSVVGADGQAETQQASAISPSIKPVDTGVNLLHQEWSRLEEVGKIICDEEEIVKDL